MRPVILVADLQQERELMNAPAEFASLDAGLLARKGEALPALSESTKAMADTRLFASQRVRAGPGPGPGSGPGSAVRQPVQPDEPHGPNAETNSQTVQSTVGKAPATKDQDPLHALTARVSFRMPMADYLRFKMAGQVLDKPGRDIMLEALRQYLDDAGLPDMSECTCLTPGIEKR